MTIIEYLENLPEGINLDFDMEDIEEELKENDNEECSFFVYIYAGSVVIYGDIIKVTNPDDVDEEELNKKIIKSLSKDLEGEVAFGWEGNIDDMYTAKETLDGAMEIFEQF